MPDSADIAVGAVSDLTKSAKQWIDANRPNGIRDAEEQLRRIQNPFIRPDMFKVDFAPPAPATAAPATAAPATAAPATAPLAGRSMAPVVAIVALGGIAGLVAFIALSKRR